MRAAIVLVVVAGCAPGASVVDAGPAGDVNLGCVNRFLGGVPTACCPSAPDCSTLPDGYPGYDCVEESNQFCSCSCQSGTWQCLC